VIKSGDGGPHCAPELELLLHLGIVIAVLGEECRHRSMSPVVAAGDLGECPDCVSTHERPRARKKLRKGIYIFEVADISKCDGNVAKELGSVNAPERTSPLPFSELRRSKADQAPQCRARGPRTRSELWRALLGGGVVWADLLTNIAAEDPIPDEGAEVAGNRTAVFDRQVCDTATCVEGVGVDECSCGACRQACSALTAARLDARLRLAFDIHEKLSEYKIAACTWCDEERILGDEADPRSLRRLAFEERSGVDTWEICNLAAERRRDTAAERVEFGLQDHVIVVSARVSRDHSARAAGKSIRRDLTWIGVVVRERDRHHRARPIKELSRIASLCTLRDEIGHLAREAAIDPALINPVSCDRSHRCEADATKSEGERLTSNDRSIFGRRHLRLDNTDFQCLPA
jgi:hypothetical protein